MDVYESALSRKHSAQVTTRLPLVPGEKNNAISARRAPTREVSSRYKSPAPSTPSGPRRCVSPHTSRAVSAASPLVQKRAQSAERKRPSTPPSPPSPSTSVHDLSLDTLRRTSVGGRPESLWPSTMRSLSVSFQSDAISVPVSKKEKPVTTAPLDRTLRPSSNVAHKLGETPSAPRKPTPERKRSPVKGKIVPDQSENSKPVDGVHSRLLAQHRWPRIGGKVSSNSLSRSVDLSDKPIRSFSTSLPGNGSYSLRRTASDSIGKSLQKSISNSSESVKVGCEIYSMDESFLPVSGKLVSTRSGDRAAISSAVRSHFSSAPGSRLPSPSKTSVAPASVSRGVSPSRSRPSTPPRGISPSRIMSSTNSQSNNSTSVLTFIADVKKGKKGANHIEDAHQLKLLYNRYLQWRLANAQSESVLHIQEVTAEGALYSVCKSTLDLWDSVISKSINLQQLKLDIKLKSVLNDQLAHLEEWAVLERDHVGSLSRAVEDLEACTLRIPVTGGAKADAESLKGAICSAVDVMQAMRSSICSLLSRAEEMNILISKLSAIAAHEKTMLTKCEGLLASMTAMQAEEMNILISKLSAIAAHEKTMLTKCEGLLASMTAMQVEDYSLRTHLIQMKQAFEKQNSFLDI